MCIEIVRAKQSLFIPVVTGGASYVDNATYDGGLQTVNNAALTMVADRMYGSPFMLPAGTYDRMGIVIGTSGAAGKLARVLLYEMAADGILPGALLLDPATNLAADSAPGTYVDHTIALVNPVDRLITVAVWSDGTPAIGGWTAPGKNWYGSSSSSAGKQAMCYRTGGTYPSTPATFGSVTAYVGSMVPRIRFRVA